MNIEEFDDIINKIEDAVMTSCHNCLYNKKCSDIMYEKGMYCTSFMPNKTCAYIRNEI